MVILGVDPGIASVGYGVVSYEKNRFTALEYDTFRTPAGQQLSERLLQIFNFFEQLVRRYPIDAMSVEELFFNTNVSTAIPVSYTHLDVYKRQGLEHRLELVRTRNGVRYYNDSIASSPTRTMACLNSFDQKLILLLGGYDKHIPFDELGEALCKKASCVILTGHTANAIESAIRGAAGFVPGSPEILHADNMEKAVGAAAGVAREGDIVVLSPACASSVSYTHLCIMAA